MQTKHDYRTTSYCYSHQLIFLVFTILVFWLSHALRAADSVILKDGRSQQGEIVGVEGGNLMLKVGAGTIGLQLNAIASISKDAPKNFEEGMAAYQAGDTGKALGLLRPIAEAFAGLPTEWAREATGAVADLYLVSDDYENAAKAFEKFQAAYGETGGGVRAEVGRARIAFAQGDSQAARQRIQPVIEQALGVFAPESSLATAYSQAFLLAGRLDEKDGDLQQALVNYLRVVTIYHQDSKAVAAANERATSLQNENPQLAVP